MKVETNVTYTKEDIENLVKLNISVKFPDQKIKSITVNFIDSYDSDDGWVPTEFKGILVVLENK